MSTDAERMTTWPERVAIGMLVVPVAIFFSTWFKPQFGIPVALVAIWLGWRIARTVEPAPLPARNELLVIAGVAFFLTWTAGLGGFFFQEWDHNFRNALLHDLIRYPWPVVWNGPNGPIVLDYYLAWSLPSALVGKLLGWRAATLALATIAFTGVFLVMLILVRVIGRWKWWIPVVFAAWSGVDILGWFVRFFIKGKLPGYGVFVDAWSYPLWYLSHLVNFYCVSHLVVPAWLITLLIVGRKVRPAAVVGLSAFLIPLGPFAALGIAPFVVWSVFHDSPDYWGSFRKAITFENILPIFAFAALCGPYYLANQGLGEKSGWFWTNAAPPTFTTWVKYASFWAFEILVPAAALWFAGVRDRLFYLTVVVLCLIPLRSTGISNDWALKVSVPGLFVLSFLTVQALVRTVAGRARSILILVVCLGMFSPIQEFWRSMVSTSIDTDGLETDYIKTFHPDHKAGPFEQRYVVNFHSKPMSESPMLQAVLRHPQP